ncbi:MAG: metalloregulator ArsR/SmtB family transcription factor [Phycisphaerales bacterium]|nr:metalloregulator ArsR/SmtB family transcription factor [Phycisphaerales bacterium]
MGSGSRSRPQPSSSSGLLDATGWTNLLAMLSDPARLRVLRALEAQELAVGELARALQMPQSTASRHIKPLFDAGLVNRRVEGTTSLYRVDHALIAQDVRALWALTRQRLVGSAQSQDDDARLAAVIALRRIGTTGFFGRIGGEWDSIRRALFGESVGSDAVLGLLDPSWVIADIGCGTGEVAQRIAPYVARVIAIDREVAMIDAAKRRLSGVRNVEFHKGDVMKLPLKDCALDAAVAMLLFHHVEDPSAAVIELARTLKVGGRLLVIDMVEHDRSEYRTTMGHQHLGFSQSDAKAWSRASGLDLDRWSRITPGVDVRGPGLFSALMTRREKA